MIRGFAAVAAIAALLCAIPWRTAIAAGKYNLVIIAVDGLRPDHLGTYGYKARDTSPFLDARAKDAVVFENAEAQASWTLPSFGALFTSRYPGEHGANSGEKTLNPKWKTLPEALHEAGYRTAGFVGGHFLDPVFGFSRGFDLYRADGVSRWRYFQNTVPQALQWIRENKESRFFVFIHGNDLHPPFDLTEQAGKVEHLYDRDYRGPVDTELVDYLFVEGYNNLTHPSLPVNIPIPDDYKQRVLRLYKDPKTVPHLVSHYDARIHGADAWIEKVFSALRETGHDRDTIVVLLSDHGMEWGEKGVLATGHHPAVWETITRVALIVWAPGLKSRRVKDLIELHDVAPTVLELLGLPPVPSFGGSSFAGLAKGEPANAKRFAFSTGGMYYRSHLGIWAASIRDERWKLIYDVSRHRFSLYDLAVDPGETRDVIAANRSTADGLMPELFRRLGLGAE